MKVAIDGLGRMGAQIVQMLVERSDHEVIAHDLSADMIENAANLGATPARSRVEVLEKFDGERAVIWLMIPASVVDEVLDEWAKILPKDSIIVDGGNSDYRLTKKRAERLKKAGVSFVDVGTSGGVHGYKNGFCMMAGADNEEDFRDIEPILQTLAKPEGAYHYFGPVGAGHFVKMTHNAIEYGMMQSLAEGYRLLREGPYDNIDLAAAGDVWQQHSVIVSWLNELTRDALREDPDLKEYSGEVGANGEAQWAWETGESLGIPMPAIEASLDVRRASQESEAGRNFATKILAAQRSGFGGHAKGGEDAASRKK
jgi:6-phosphogluconate dehydrogenase